MKIPITQTVLDADSLADWLHENAQTDMLAAGVGLDAQERPFAAWVNPDMWPEVAAMAVLAGTNDEEEPAEDLLEFPVFMLKTRGE